MSRRVGILLLGSLAACLILACDRVDAPSVGDGEGEAIFEAVLGQPEVGCEVSPLCPQVRQELKQAMQDFVDLHGGGLLFGAMPAKRPQPHLYVEGEIRRYDRLRVASLSKTFLSYIALRQGLDLDATVDAWFPAEHYDRSDEITIRMLLSHKSGVPEYVNLIDFSTERNPQELVDVAYYERPLDFDPDTSWCYSNTNYIMLGIILEQVTGRDYESLLLDHFHAVAPSLYIDDGRGNNFPAGYIDPWPIHWSLPWTAGAMIGSAADVLKGYRFIASQPEFAVMQQWADRSSQCDVEIVFGDEYGLGLQEYQSDGFGVGIGHDGDIIARSFIVKVDETFYFIHTTTPILNADLKSIGETLVSVCENSP